MPDIKPNDPDEIAAERHVQDIMEPNTPVAPVQPDELITPQPDSPEKLASAGNGQPSTAPEVTGVSDTPDEPEKLDSQPAEPADLPADESDPETDKAVDDIMKKDGDEALKAQDAAAAEQSDPAGRRPRFKARWAAWWGNPRKRWGSVAAIVIVLAALFIVPLTRYNILGVIVKAPVVVQVVDSKTGKPVSGALVELSGNHAETQADGKAKLRVNTGSGVLKVSKKYYRGSSAGKLVAFSGNNFRASLLATGRQVQVKLVNKLTGQPVSDGTINAGGAKAKSDAKGLATLVIASGAATQAGSVSLDGYNTAPVTIVAGGNLAKNTFAVVPSGKLYLLSNLSGKIDVVKTNLDGSARQTVLAGTGSEDPNNTSLLASRDWKYLALLANRSGSGAAVYLINTATDKLTTIDQGAATFSLYGWSGDTLIYQAVHTTVADWQTGQQTLKAFDPATGKPLLLDQTQASGTSESDYLKQYFGTVYLMGNQVVYGKNWTASYGDWSQLGTKQAELDGIAADGSGHKTIKTFALADGTQASNVAIDIEPYAPAGLYLHFANGASDQFFDYAAGQVSADAKLTSNQFWSGAYPTYLQSPSGGQTFWAEQRDGKNTLFIGDTNGGSPKQIASLSDYSPYGWYTDHYVLVSKNSSELYVMPAAGGTPLKITDYYKPPLNYAGYGGGYGGL